MLSSLRHRPLLLFTLGLTLGIAAHARVSSSPSFLMTAAFLIVAIAVFVPFGKRTLVTIGCYAAPGLAAGLLLITAYTTISPSDISHLARESAFMDVTGTVADDPHALPGRVLFTLNAERVQQAGKSAKVAGFVAVALRVPKDQHVPLQYGETVTARGFLEVPQDATNPGAFSWREYLARRGVFCTLKVRDPAMLHAIGTPHQSNSLLKIGLQLRHRFVTGIDGGLHRPESAVLAGILVGERSDLPADLKADFIHTGTVHILASAGLHVGIIAFWLFVLLEKLTLPRKWSALSAIGILWLYDIAADGRPSVTRAVIMATIYFSAIVFEREPDLPTTIAAAALVILTTQPTALLDTGFQLSFCTVITLAALMPVWHSQSRARLSKTKLSPRTFKVALWMLDLIGLSLVAQLGSAPIVAAAYNEVSLSGLLANLLVVPALFVVIPLGLLSILGSALWQPAGHALFALVSYPIVYIIAVVRDFGGTSGFRAVQSPSLWMIGMYYAVVWGAAWRIGGREAAAAYA